MAMYYAVDRRKPLVYLTVDMSFQITRLGIFLNWCTVLDIVFYKVVRRADKSWGHVAWHPERGRIVRTSH